MKLEGSERRASDLHAAAATEAGPAFGSARRPSAGLALEDEDVGRRESRFKKPAQPPLWPRLYMPSSASAALAGRTPVLKPVGRLR